jgi:multiple sugar transport system substrate-binding protein
MNGTVAAAAERSGVTGVTGVTRRSAFAGSGLVAGVLAVACGGPAAMPGGELPKPVAGPMELRVATNTSIQNLPGWEKAARGYEAKYPSRTVKLEHATGTAYSERMVSQQAAGDPPPIFYTSTTGIHNFGPKGIFTDLMPLVKVDRTINLKDIPDRALRGYSWANTLYGMPVMADTRYLHYNVSLFQQIGLPLLPKEWNDDSFTLDTFVDYAQRLTDPAKGIWGFVHGESWPRAAVYQFGADYWDDRSYTTKCVLDAQPAVEALQWMQDTAHKWRFAPSPQQAAAQGITSSDNAFLQGKAAMVLGGYKHTAAIFPAAQGFEWSIAPLPRGRAKGTNVTVVGFAVPKGTKYLAEAFEWIKWTTFQDGACSIMGLASQAVSDKVERFKCSPLPEWQTKMTQDGLKSSGRVEADHPNVKPEMWTVISAEVDRLMGNEQSARDAGKRIVEQVNGLFQPYVVPRS